MASVPPLFRTLIWPVKLVLLPARVRVPGPLLVSDDPVVPVTAPVMARVAPLAPTSIVWSVLAAAPRVTGMLSTSPIAPAWTTMNPVAEDADDRPRVIWLPPTVY